MLSRTKATDGRQASPRLGAAGEAAFRSSDMPASNYGSSQHRPAVPVVEGYLAVEQLAGQQVLRFMPTVRRHDIEMGYGLKACIATGVGLEQDQKD